jgi:hypothetical protein
VQLLYFSAQGSVFVAANIITTLPLIMNAATHIFVFTPESFTVCPISREQGLGCLHRENLNDKASGLS